MRRGWLIVVGALGACAPESEDARWQPAAEREPSLAIESLLEPGTPAPASSLMRVVTYNVHFAPDIDALAELFTSPPLDQATAFLLQEIDGVPDEGASRARQLAEATSMAFAYLPSKRKGDGTHGMAILSRRPLSNVRFMDLPFFGTSIRQDGRVALAASIDGIDVVNVHLFLQMGIAERIVQLAPTTRGLGERVIIGGDLNTNPYAWSDMIPVSPIEPITDLDVAAIVDDAMVEFGFVPGTAESGPTHRSAAGELRLDSLYVRGLVPESSRVERDVELSDHWPVWLDARAP